MRFHPALFNQQVQSANAPSGSPQVEFLDAGSMVALTSTGSVPLPTHSPGDLLILHRMHDGGTRTSANLPAPVGWNKLVGEVVDEAPPVSTTYTGVYWKIAGVSESAPTLTIGTTGVTIATITAWSSGFPVVDSKTVWRDLDTDSTIDLEAITLPEAGSVALWLVDNSDDNNMGANTGGTLVYGGTSYEQSATESGSGIAAVYQESASAATIGPYTLDNQNGSTTADTGGVIALRIEPTTGVVGELVAEATVVTTGPADTITVPATAQEGDFLVFTSMVTYSVDPTFSSKDYAWTNLRKFNNVAGMAGKVSTTFVGSPANSGTTVQPGDVLNLNGTGGPGILKLFVFRNVTTATAGTFSNFPAESDGVFTASGITMPDTGRLLHLTVGAYQDVNDLASTTVGATEIANTINSGSSRREFVHATIETVSAGTTGTRAVTTADTDVRAMCGLIGMT